MFNIPDTIDVIELITNDINVAILKLIAITGISMNVPIVVIDTIIPLLIYALLSNDLGDWGLASLILSLPNILSASNFLASSLTFNLPCIENPIKVVTVNTSLIIVNNHSYHSGLCHLIPGAVYYCANLANNICNTSNY